MRSRPRAGKQPCHHNYAAGEDLFEHPPAAHVRRPRLGHESHATGLDRNELGALLAATGLGQSAKHPLIWLLTLNGLRSPKPLVPTSRLWASNAGTGLVITYKGGKVTIPLTPRTARATGLTVGERSDRQLFLAADGRRLTGKVPPGSGYRPFRCGVGKAPEREPFGFCAGPFQAIAARRSRSEDSVYYGHGAVPRPGRAQRVVLPAAAERHRRVDPSLFAMIMETCLHGRGMPGEQLRSASRNTPYGPFPARR